MTYKSTRKRIGSLLLDESNSRIPLDQRSKEQRELLHELLEHEDVKGLAKKIARLGLHQHERLVVMPAEKKNRFVVIEGNRRLAAIRLLFNPELAAKASDVKYFRRLSAIANTSMLTSVDVLIVPDRVAAAPIMTSEHIGDSKRRWSSVQQASHFREMIDAGLEIGEIAENAGVSVGYVRGFLRSETLYKIALQLDYMPDEREKIKSRKFPLTTLERFLEFPSGRKLLGIELDDDQGFRGVVHPDRFKAVLKKVAVEVATKPGLTRIINKDEDFKGYAAEIEPDLPKTRKRGSFSPDELLGKAKNESEEDENNEQRKPQRHSRTQSKSIVPNGFACRSRDQRVSAVFGELKKLPIATYRNCVGVMLRVLLDIALWRYLMSINHREAVIDHCDSGRKKRKNNPEWTPALRETMSYIVEKRLLPGVTADGYRAIRSLLARKSDYIVTIDGFNDFTHSSHATPTEGDLRALWHRAEPLLEVILDDHGNQN